MFLTEKVYNFRTVKFSALFEATCRVEARDRPGIATLLKKNGKFGKNRGATVCQP
jgi:hypothetical protein